MANGLTGTLQYFKCQLSPFLRCRLAIFRRASVAHHPSGLFFIESDRGSHVGWRHRGKPRRLHDHDAIRHSVVAEGTLRRPLEFAAGDELAGAGLSENLAVFGNDLAATDHHDR